MSYDSEEVIFKETILNAYKYKKANAKIVIQKIFANYPELRKEAKSLLPKIQEKVVEINSYSWEKIEEIVTKNYSEDIEIEEKKRDYLPEMVDAVKGKVKVRYPPEPSKAPHIGQMLSFCINHLVAERYEGKRVLRFDDTNPDTVKSEFYEQFREAISWLGLQIDEEIIASNHMNEYYTKAREMLENEQAYVCICDRETMAKLRAEQKRCSCHTNHSNEENIELFENILENNFSPGEVVIRLKGDMESQN
ncbi:MAG: glutamate--tRNA ligase, partial [Candidatus Heimdallarchaeota archaeon]|nr:glutamate--tRNA ligase [Candidatus Heimdallarchaeota archaeon]